MKLHASIWESIFGIAPMYGGQLRLPPNLRSEDIQALKKCGFKPMWTDRGARYCADMAPGWTVNEDHALFDEKGRERGRIRWSLDKSDIDWKRKFYPERIMRYNHDNPDPDDDAYLDLAAICSSDPTFGWDKNEYELPDQRKAKNVRERAGTQSQDKW